MARFAFEDAAVDKLLAVVAVFPLLYVLFTYWHQTRLSFEDGVVVAELCIVGATLLSRRPAIRVTRDAKLWLLAGVSVYWPLIFAEAYEPGIAVAPREATLIVSFLAFLISIWARFALGRGIGLVPAERGICVVGPYRYIRHPIYSALMLSILSANLQSFSLLNACLDLTWCALLAAKANAEERFLLVSPAYAAYAREVPYRWIPIPRAHRSCIERASHH